MSDSDSLGQKLDLLIACTLDQRHSRFSERPDYSNADCPYSLSYLDKLKMLHRITGDIGSPEVIVQANEGTVDSLLYDFSRGLYEICPLADLDYTKEADLEKKRAWVLASYELSLSILKISRLALNVIED